MTKVIICFSSRGEELIKKLNRLMTDADISPAKGYACYETQVKDTEPDRGHPGEGLPHIGADEFVRLGFEKGYALIFIGAVGIAVRTVAPYISDKLHDCPVVVIDETASYVIPVLSGHAGGANKLAVILAELLGAVPVITTATDARQAFSADVFAAENLLKIQNRDGIKKVSAKALEGKAISLSVKDYPPSEPVDIIVANETDREYSLLLSPKRYVIGLGMKKNADPAIVEAFILSLIREKGIDTSDIYALATVDIKENEEAISFFSDKYRIPVISFDVPLLNRARGEFTSSDFVKKTTGTDNVCERAAVLAAGPGGVLTVKKTCASMVTAAIAMRKL